MLVKNGITYELFQEKDLGPTINCLVDVFTSAEPIATAIEITSGEFFPFAELVCQNTIEDELSYIAKDLSTSEVVGFIISEDLSTYLSLSEEISKNLPEKFEIIFQLLNELHEQYEINQKVVKGEVLHIFLEGVKKQYRNRKILNNLLDLTLNLARHKGFSRAIAECTGNISQHVARKYGFEDRCFIDYPTYEYRGTKVFEGIKEHRSCILMEKFIPVDYNLAGPIPTLTSTDLTTLSDVMYQVKK